MQPVAVGVGAEPGLLRRERHRGGGHLHGDALERLQPDPAAELVSVRRRRLDFEEWTGTGSSQALEFVDPPDHETKSSYGVTVAVTDGSASAPPLEVTVNVTDVNEPPSKPSGRPAVEMEEGGTDTGAEYTSTDPEGTTIQWSLTGDDFEALQISEEGRLTFVEAPDYEAPGTRTRTGTTR